MLKVLFGFIIFICVSVIPDNEVVAQEKSRYEKIQERKNKANRRLKRRGDKSRKGKRKFTQFKIRNRQGDKAYKGDITGRKVRSRISLTKRSRAAHPQPNPYAGRRKQTEASRAKAFKRTVRFSQKPTERAWKGNLTGSRIATKDFRSEKQKIKAGRSPLSGGGISGERDGARFTGQGFKGVRSISGRSDGSRKRNRIVPRSSSGAYTVRKRAKPYAIRERSKWESAYKGDITGRKFQTKRTLDRPTIQAAPEVNYSFQGKGRRGDRAYKGKITGGYKSATSAKEKAWKNDISGTKLRIRTSGQPKFNDPHFRPYYSRKRKGDKAFRGKLPGGGYKTAGRKIERTSRALPQKAPAAGSERAIRFQGNMKAQKPLKGGGSISEKLRNNNGNPIQGRGYRDQDQRVAKFQGNLKGRKPLKGGGSISEKLRNNNGNPIQGRGFKEQDQRVARFQGNIKGGKPLKGGGSISAKLRNNDGRPIQGRGFKDQDQRIARFQGNLKGGKPLKGGGSISAKLRNNDGKPIQGRGFKDQDQRIARFQGNIKGGRPLKGGGSIARNQCNNDGKPIQGRGFKDQDQKIAGFQGNLKQRRNTDITDQDRKTARHTGNIKQWKYKTGPLDEMKYTGSFKRTGKHKMNPNSPDEGLKTKAPSKATAKASDFQGRFKVTGKFKQNPNSADEALPGKMPTKATTKAMDYQGRIKLTSKYKKNPNSADEALPGIGPKKPMIAASKYQGTLKINRFAYKNRPNAVKGSMRGIGPSKAAIAASNYQGNLKMRKGQLADKHPSYKFDRPQDNLVDKTKFSLKLLWSKLFKKSENQPQMLKEKERKPRYDKGEQGLWND
ncbi:hypothetical protein E1176_13245 [Fulvivirga sp. RKSG066]|uniref:hypothetical protein n=1 Tax=Fulvivirga aurantia TaxID=2529383 RepID=UPI0012BD0AAF|nr:hypothetical protein [Fulvivirga aurantia]MTI21991.1 hypothetical protein [Fulvivirga aurantia]